MTLRLVLPRVCCVRGRFLDRRFIWAATFGGLSGEKRKRKRRRWTCYTRDKEMSTTEALRTQLDNVRREVHELQVENQKLRTQCSEEAWEELKEEVTDLRRQLHMAQENEAGTNQNLSESREEVTELKQQINELNEHVNKLQQTISELSSDNEQLDSELAQSRVQHDDITQELSRMSELSAQNIEREREQSELKYYRALEAERAKWEARETRLIAQLEKRSAHEVTRQSGVPLTPACPPVVMTSSAPSEIVAIDSEGTVTPSRILNVTRDSLNTQGIHTGLSAASSVTARPTTSSVAVMPTTPGVVTTPLSSTSSPIATSGVTDIPIVGLGAPLSPRETVSRLRMGMVPSQSRLGPAVVSSSSPFTAAAAITTSPTIELPATPLITGPGRVSSGSSGSLFSAPIAETSTAGTVEGLPIHTTLVPYMSMMPGQQLPPISKFSGEDPDGEGESFEDWIEQFESIANMYHWDAQARLVNLTTHLRGQAYAFYRTCSPQQRSNYETLKAQLVTRFTPVRIQAVHSNLFHQHQQEESETVDHYAQELRKLFYKAYPRAGLDGGDTEGMGRAVLAYQFVAGLTPVVRTKVAGVEGSFEQLLVKARFEEAKIRDLATSQGGRQKHTTTDASNQGRSDPHPGGGRQGGGGQPQPGKLERPGARSSNNRCFVCQGVGHLARNCPFRGRSAPMEARGMSQVSTRSGPNRPPSATTANLQEDSIVGTQQNIPSKVERLRQELQAAELEESLQNASVTTHGLSQGPSPDGSNKGGVQFGPTVTAEILIEHPVQALLDTGSPISMVSVEFLLRVLLAATGTDRTKEELKDEARRRIEPTTISVRNFGGGEVNIIGQARVKLSRGAYCCLATMLVQKGTQLKVLLGTDLLPKIGFSFVGNGEPTDLLTGLGYKPEEESDSNVETVVSSVRVTVCLLHAVKVPGRHGRLVKVQVDNINNWEGKPMLFSPQQHKEEWAGIVAASCVTGKDSLILTVENHNLYPITLPAGEVMGEMEEVEVMSPGERHTSNLDVCNVQPIAEPYGVGTDFCSPERAKKLFSVLEMESSLEKEQEQALTKTIEEFNDVFALSSDELKCTELTQHIIDTEGHAPIKQLPRRTPFALRKKIEEMIQEMLERGVVTYSHSPWASPVVLVAKKDGTTRFCVDYRRLNSITRMDTFPLPRIDDSLDLLANTAYFTTLDLMSGYWQVGMDPESQPKTAFCSHSGLYEFTVMPFGLCNAPATFQRLMETVLAGLARDKCLVYLDDIFGYGERF